MQAPLKRKKQMMAIRDELKQSSTSSPSSPSYSPLFPPRYISSQYLADSSLNIDVSQYDFTLHTSPTTGMSTKDENDPTVIIILYILPIFPLGFSVHFVRGAT